MIPSNWLTILLAALLRPLSTIRTVNDVKCLAKENLENTKFHESLFNNMVPRSSVHFRPMKQDKSQLEASVLVKVLGKKKGTTQYESPYARVLSTYRGWEISPDMKQYEKFLTSVCGEFDFKNSFAAVMEPRDGGVTLKLSLCNPRIVKNISLGYSTGPLIVMVICNVAVGMRRRSADQQEGISIDKEFIESLRGKTFKECEPNQFIESSSIQFEDDRDREYPKAKLTLKLKASLRQNYTELLKTPFFPVVPGKVQNHWVIELPPQRPAVGLGEGDKGGGMEAFYAKLYKYTYHNADKAFSVDITSLDRVPVAIITIGKEPKNVVWKKIALVEEKPVIGKKRQSECVVS